MGLARAARGSSVTALLLVAVTVLGCSDKSVEPVNLPSGEEALDFTLTFDQAELTTLEDVHLMLTIHDQHGAMMMGFSDVAIQHRLVGTTDWQSIPMTAMSDHFDGHHRFGSAGEYEMRVVGMPHHHDSHMHGTQELHHMDSHYYVHRAYREAGGYRIEYESIPGGIHAGEAGAHCFWVLDPVRDLPVGGLGPTLHCLQSDGEEHLYALEETSPGIYDSEHTVTSAGVTALTLRFTGADSNPAEARFDFLVAASP